MPRSRERSTQKTGQTRSYKRRKLVSRGIKPKRGSGCIIVKRRGEDLRQELEARWQLMNRDLERVEFFWEKVMNDSAFSETREWNEIRPIVMKWELAENAKTIFDYRNKMRRLKTLIDHFKPGYDYELTVDEVVEIGS